MAGVHRFEEVDSLRGMAAFFVVLNHCLLLWQTPLAPWFVALLRSPLGLAFGGSKSVYLFFIMSGFVLFLPYKKRPEGQDYRIYAVKRVCRIYLPYLAALVVAVGADLLFFRPVPGFYQGVTWTRPFPLKVLVEHVLFLGVYPPHEFNFAFWSLVQEMRISLIYPLVAYLAFRMSLAWSVLLGCFLVGFATFGDVHMPVWIWLTISCFGMFLIGAAIARHLERILSFFQVRGGVYRSGFFLLALIPLWMVDLAPLAVRRQVWMFPCHVLGAAMILVLALTTKHFKGFLHLGPMRWLGKVSYSLYLIHGTILYSLYSLYWSRFNHLALLGIGVVLSIGLSAVFHDWVEIPSMAMGRRLAGRVNTRQQVVLAAK